MYVYLEKYVHALTHQGPSGGRGKDEEHDRSSLGKGHISNTCEATEGIMIINNAGTVAL